MSTDSKLATTITPIGRTNNYVSKINSTANIRAFLSFRSKEKKYMGSILQTYGSRLFYFM